MIELTKGATPAWLTENQAQKTAEYKAAPADKKPSPWRAHEVVAALKLETAKKCMYCECFIDDASYSAVEHIQPKSKFEDLVLEWSNLGLACARCNTNKGEYWTSDPELQMLNPYDDALDVHIEFRGPLTIAALSSTRGRNTVRKFKFVEREDLLVSRMRAIEDLEAKLRLWHDEENDERKALYAEDVSAAISSDREFSAVLTAYATESGFAVSD